MLSFSSYMEQLWVLCNGSSSMMRSGAHPSACPSYDSGNGKKSFSHHEISSMYSLQGELPLEGAPVLVLSHPGWVQICPRAHDIPKMFAATEETSSSISRKKVILRRQEQVWNKEGVPGTVVRDFSRRSAEFLSSLISTMCKVEGVY